MMHFILSTWRVCSD